MAFEGAVIKGESAEGEGSGGSEGQDEQETVGRVRQPEARGMPLPTVGVEVSQASLLPVADGIVVSAGGGVVGNQTPIILVAFSPHDKYRCRQPTGLLEDLTGAAPRLTRSVDEVLEGAAEGVRA